MDVAWVGGEQGAEKEEDFARAVGGGMASCVSRGEKRSRWRRLTRELRGPCRKRFEDLGCLWVLDLVALEDSQYGRWDSRSCR